VAIDTTAGVWGFGLITPWVGRRNVGFIAAAVDDPAYDPWPANWRELILKRIFYDPDPNTGLDRSLRTYISTISSGRAYFDADLLGMVNVPGCGAGPPIQATANSNLYDVVCVVFPGGSHSCRGMAVLRTNTPFPYFNPPRSPNNLLGWCRFRIDESLGVWGMEFLHAATGFDDLYKTQPHPGNFDEMACACGTHASSFTKAKLGWGSVIQAASTEVTSVTLHAVSLPQPPPKGRVTGLRIPTSDNRYYLVEARLKTDAYERGSAGLSSGIKSEGVVVYEVDESVWAPMKLRTLTALPVGGSYRNDADRVAVRVKSAVPGGFVVEVGACELIRRTIELLRQEVEALQRDLNMGEENKVIIIQLIRQLLAKIAELEQRARALGCALPRLQIESYGAETSHLELPEVAPPEPTPEEPSPAEELLPGEPDSGEEVPAHEDLHSVDLPWQSSSASP
jgi:hypothetical protein